MSNLDILIAEDNPKDFEFLEHLLTDWDESVVITRAPNGQAALEIGLTRDNPLVISDIQMPEMNGIDFAAQPVGEKTAGPDYFLESVQR